MAHYCATVNSPRPVDEIYRYLADFRSAAEWDPGIDESLHINDGEPIAVGAIFRVTTKTRFSTVVLEYTTTELDPPRRIALRGVNRTMTSIDVITIEVAPGGGSRVTYDATLELHGLRKLADPLLDRGFQRLGDRSRVGLERALNVS